MNKSERKEVNKALAYASAGYIDIAARTLATLVRSARTTRSRNELITLAAGYPAIAQHAEFRSAL